MIKIRKLNNGTLLVPLRVMGNDGSIGDTIEEIRPGHEQYPKYLNEYQKRQEKELKYKDITNELLTESSSKQKMI